MENKFFTFIKPYLSYIDKGDFFRKPFGWLYAVIAILNLLAPLFLLYVFIDNGFFSAGAKFLFAFLLIWLVLAGAGWISFQLWWDRRAVVADTKGGSDEFVATPVFSHFIQTFGEWFGTYIAIVGFLCSLLALIFMGTEGLGMLAMVGLGSVVGSSFAMIFLFPLYGFLIIVASRFVAEMMRGVAAIANNTKK